MELYIIRHGTPDYETDTLTELGWREARAVGVRVARLAPDRIYTSPMGRAKQTAEPALELLGMTPSVEEWMAEHWYYMQFPDYDAGDKGGYSFNLQKGVYGFYDHCRHDRTELMRQLVSRSDEFLSRHGYERRGAVYMARTPTEERIAVFCHAGFGSAWIAHLLGMPPEYGFFHINLHMTSVTRINFYADEKGYAHTVCEYLNDVAHKAGVE